MVFKFKDLKKAISLGFWKSFSEVLTEMTAGRVFFLIIPAPLHVKCSLDTVDKGRKISSESRISGCKFCRMVTLASSRAIGLLRITPPDVTRSKKDRPNTRLESNFSAAPRGDPITHAQRYWLVWYSIIIFKNPCDSACGEMTTREESNRNCRSQE